MTFQHCISLVSAPAPFRRLVGLAVVAYLLTACGLPGSSETLPVSFTTAPTSESTASTTTPVRSVNTAGASPTFTPSLAPATVAGRIAYVRTMNRAAGEYDLYTMAPDASDARELTDLPGLETDPTWSPDAQALAFVATRDSTDPADCASGYVEFRCNFEIYRINADGSGLVRLTHSQNVDRTPDWSPDGSQIIYSSRAVGQPSGYLYIMQADGSDPHAITSGPYDDQTPRWSPDGTHIAFTRSTDADTQVWLAEADGSQAAQISHGSGYSMRPAWSPDGSQIAVVTFGQTDHFGQIALLHADGSSARLIPHVRVALGYTPAWAPDGKSLVYVPYEPGYYNLARTDLDGTHVKALTNYDAFYSSPAWSVERH